MTGKSFSSVWLREPRKAGGPGRSREEIVKAAVELLDEEGLQGLSMRKLGAKLSAGATSVYWYVANKDELLELAYDEVWRMMTVPDPEEVGWRDSAAALAHSMRRVILRYPWAADLIGRMPALGPNAMRVANGMRKMFDLAGFRGLDIDFANSTLTAYVFGMTIPEVAWNATMGDLDDYDADKTREMVRKAAADYPDMLKRIDMGSYEDPAYMRELCFDFGLVSLLDGLERRLTT
ncbi:TetR family transcriptional regulator [Nonomuraea sp. MG754425]|uniref:TetR/AcrR family transcriptional regulator C-terminal domain-containing protein n=1 Tax=Nonomuraea sp. MG754425 TaxID=2570319 RepID=UPI001F008534|nr:TetR/AcrR family transcriptional regulator C-terminal domain-containing protein [Nonomuraea sp. MG754425]MCF6475231.1 TetR family transcriptional regulator [Nonomuraea sp. MG754425]